MKLFFSAIRLFLVFSLTMLGQITNAHAANVTRTFVIHTQNNINASGGTAGSLLLSANLGRNYLLIQNNSSESIYVKFGSAFTGTEGIVISSGGNYEPAAIPLTSVYVKGFTGSDAVAVLEGDGL